MKYLARQDKNFDPVNCEMTKRVQEAHKLYTREKEEEMKCKEEIKKKLKVAQDKVASKRSAKMVMMVAAKKAKKTHSRAMKQRGRTNTI